MPLQQMVFTINGLSKTILVISDTHIPYSHRDYIKFLRAVKKKYKPDIIIHIGDELDYHAISFHDSDSSLPTSDRELDNSIIEIQEGLHKLFPEMRLLESNHGSLVTRKMKHHGIPLRVLKPLNELYETPLWTWHFEILVSTKLGKVLFNHGKVATYGKGCKEQNYSLVQGHYHGKCEITWHRTSTSERFNMFVGCLVDEYSMAMAYGRNNLPKPIHNVGIIDKNGMPHNVRMILDKKGRWVGHL
jgi:metallophosphoesterase superfamily enzyme